MPTHDALVAAWRRWQHAAGPWQGWTVCPTLLSPTAPCVTRNDRRRRPKSLADQLEPTLRAGGAAYVLELEPVLGVQLAAELAARYLAHPVLVLPRWPYQLAVLPTRHLIAALLHEAARLPVRRVRLENVVFVVDAERNRPLPERSTTDPRADNRYTLSIFDLPNLATLRARGIQRVVRVLHAHHA